MSSVSDPPQPATAQPTPLLRRPQSTPPPEQLLFSVEQAAAVSRLSRHRIERLMAEERVNAVPHPYGVRKRLLPYRDVLMMCMEGEVREAIGSGADGSNQRFAAIARALAETPGADRHGCLLVRRTTAEWFVEFDEARAKLDASGAAVLVFPGSVQRRLAREIAGDMVLCPARVTG